MLGCVRSEVGRRVTCSRRFLAGNAQALRDWYNDGADGAIDWGSPGDFDACVSIASKYVDDPEGFCNERHQDATGEPPGHAAGESDKVASIREAFKANYNNAQPRGTAGAWNTAASVQHSHKHPPSHCNDPEHNTGKRTHLHVHGVNVGFGNSKQRVTKYSEDEPRDDHGRWEGGGSSSGGGGRVLGPEGANTGASAGRTQAEADAKLANLLRPGEGRNWLASHAGHVPPASGQTRVVVGANPINEHFASHIAGPFKVAKLREFFAEWLSKYSEDEPRDDHGRWEGGGGGSSSGGGGGRDEHGRFGSAPGEREALATAAGRHAAFLDMSGGKNSSGSSHERVGVKEIRQAYDNQKATYHWQVQGERGGNAVGNPAAYPRQDLGQAQSHSSYGWQGGSASP